MSESESLSPAELGILLHHCVSPADYPYPSSVYNETVERFKVEGVFEFSHELDNGYAVTDLGKAWIECILRTPKPKQVWVDSAGVVVLDPSG